MDWRNCSGESKYYGRAAPCRLWGVYSHGGLFYCQHHFPEGAIKIKSKVQIRKEAKEESARRRAAEVKACAGFTTEELEAGFSYRQKTVDGLKRAGFEMGKEAAAELIAVARPDDAVDWLIGVIRALPYPEQPPEEPEAA